MTDKNSKDANPLNFISQLSYNKDHPVSNSLIYWTKKGTINNINNIHNFGSLVEKAPLASVMSTTGYNKQQTFT